MSLDLSHFQNPKMAIIRLLRSQCLCSNDKACSEKKNMPQRTEEQTLALLKYKEELQQKLARERAKLNEIPCVITLAQEIQDVKQIISGLTRENRERIEYIKTMERDLEVEKVQFYHHSREQEAEMIQHEKLQAEYANLLRTLEVTNDENQRLIRRLANQ